MICVKSFPAPEIDRREILRYAGVKESTPEIEALLNECISESVDKIFYKACYREYPICRCGEEIDLGFTKTNSSSLIKLLDGCDKVIVFCATIGADIDRLIKKHSLLSPSRSVMLGAIGTERVEALCDMLCDEIAESVAENNFVCTRRFSPGYGDLPLYMQRDIFLSLDCTRKIGVNLGENLFMTPTKSVTAVFGIKNAK